MNERLSRLNERVRILQDDMELYVKDMLRANEGFLCLHDEDELYKPVLLMWNDMFDYPQSECIYAIALEGNEILVWGESNDITERGSMLKQDLIDYELAYSLNDGDVDKFSTLSHIVEFLTIKDK